MDVTIVANPVAGRGRAVALADRLLGELIAHSVHAEIVMPTRLQMRRVVSEAVERGPGAVVACGGDGTIHQVLQSVAGTDVAFGMLPAGTGNDIARELDVPAVTGLAYAIAAREFVRVDLAQCSTSDGTTEWFLGVLSTGFDSTVNERANRMRWPTGRAKYLAGVALELPRFTAREYRVRVDDVEFHGRGMLVCIANAGTYGGGMRVCPGARTDDGLLDITWVDEISTLEFLKVLPRVFNGTHVTHPAVRVLRGRDLHVEAPGQVAYADGERIGPLPVAIQVLPQALRVVSRRAPSAT